MIALALAPVARALKPLAVPLAAALACVAAGWYVLDMRADLTRAEIANAALTQSLETANTYNARLAAANERQAQSAELYGRRASALSETLSDTLERLSHEPQTTACLDSPTSRVGLDGLRAQWRAYDAARLSGDRPGGVAPTP